MKCRVKRDHIANPIDAEAHQTNSAKLTERFTDDLEEAKDCRIYRDPIT